MSIFVTRVQQAGAKSWITLQLGSKSPVKRLIAKVDDADVATFPKDTDADVTESAGMWIPTPAVGRHRVSIVGRNDFGCTAEGVALLDFVAR